MQRQYLINFAPYIPALKGWVLRRFLINHKILFTKQDSPHGKKRESFVNFGGSIFN
jgi:hypothetical protein